MAETFRTTRRVEFHDTDAAGIMHFAAYFDFMEEAEHEFLRHVGLSVMTEDAQGTIGWPRVQANCDYLRPVRFEYELSIDVSISQLGGKSVTYVFELAHEQRPVARGSMTSVCCRILPGTKPQSMAIPDDFLHRLGPYVRP